MSPDDGIRACLYYHKAAYTTSSCNPNAHLYLLFTDTRVSVRICKSYLNPHDALNLTCWVLLRTRALDSLFDGLVNKSQGDDKLAGRGGRSLVFGG